MAMAVRWCMTWKSESLMLVMCISIQDLFDVSTLQVQKQVWRFCISKLLLLFGMLVQISIHCILSVLWIGHAMRYACPCIETWMTVS